MKWRYNFATMCCPGRTRAVGFLMYPQKRGRPLDSLDDNFKYSPERSIYNS